MTHIDLFSGIGGFALAASRVFPNYQTLTFCDINPFAQKVLRKNFPDVPIESDIRNLKGDTFGTVDLLTGGFPCQPFSAAGKRKGTDDNRFLWPEMLRVIREAQPTWVVGENVGGIYTIDNGVVFENVCLDLEAEGYEVQPICIPASAKGAPHRRDRWWFVANAVRKRQRIPSSIGQLERRRPCEHAPCEIESGYCDVANANGLGRGRRGATGNNHRERAIHKDIANDGNEVWSETKRGYCDATDTSSAWDNDWLEVATAFCRVDDGLPRQLDKHRKHRLEALGNAIVPQVAEEIFRGML